MEQNKTKFSACMKIEAHKTFKLCVSIIIKRLHHCTGVLITGRGSYTDADWLKLCDAS